MHSRFACNVNIICYPRNFRESGTNALDSACAIFVFSFGFRFFRFLVFFMERTISATWRSMMKEILASRVRLLIGCLPDNCEVYIQGLTTNPEHNNKFGVIESFDGERYTVSVIEVGVSILVEPCNENAQNFEPQLFVKISAKDFTAPRIAEDKEEVRMCKKNAAVLQTVFRAFNARSPNQATPSLPCQSKTPYLHSLTLRCAVTHVLCLVLNKCGESAQVMSKTGVKWATVCTELIPLI